MNSKSILTRKTMGLDHRVWRVMILALILSSGLLGYKLMDHPKCKPVNFKIKAISGNDSVFYTDEILSFNALSSAENITWDFGDNTSIQEGEFVTHRFETEGKYYIKTTMNSGCDSIQPITIKRALSDSNNNKEVIEGHNNTFVGSNENFICLQTADNYEWNISEHPEYASRSGPSTTYKFLQPGDFIIELTLNKDRLKKFTKSVHVEDIAKPVSKPDKIGPLIPKDMKPLPKIVLSDATFKEYIGKVVSGDYTASDFNNYLCNGAATPATVNGDKETFGQACEELTGKRKHQHILWKRTIKIKSAHLNRGADNCVTSVEINYH
jgi:hypothetical protein